MLAVTFALPEESRDFRSPSPDVVVVHTGMGPQRCRRRMTAFLAETPELYGVISAGYAGGLRPDWPAGTLVLAENYTTPEWLAEACGALAERVTIGRLVSVEAPVESPADKARLRAETGADAVDMETAVLAGLCAERGIPFLSLRVISDSATEELAVPFSVCFDAETERPRISALLGYLLTHPQKILRFAAFVRETAVARKRLALAVQKVIETYRHNTETAIRPHPVAG